MLGWATRRATRIRDLRRANLRTALDVDIMAAFSLDEADGFRLVEALEKAVDDGAAHDAAGQIRQRLLGRDYEPVRFSAAERRAVVAALDEVLEGRTEGHALSPRRLSALRFALRESDG
jgi:hypothetical protein